MAFSPAEERWINGMRTVLRRKIGFAIIFFVAAAVAFYDSYSIGVSHTLPDGAIVLTQGFRSLLVGFFLLIFGMRSLYPSPRDQLIISLADRLREQAKTESSDRAPRAASATKD